MNPKTKRRVGLGLVTLLIIVLGLFFAQKYGYLGALVNIGNWTYQEQGIAFEGNGFNSNFRTWTNIIDGDWNTFGDSAQCGDFQHVYINYTKPQNAISANWQLKYNLPSPVTSNFTIPTGCFNAFNNGTIIVGIKVNHSVGCTTYNTAGFYCQKNDLTWDTLYEIYTTSDFAVFEEAIWWNIGQESCGNNVIDGPEVCDGTALGGNSCTTFGYTGGTLSCNSACSGFVKTACTSPPVQTCGNNITEGTELCDGGTKPCITTNGYSGTQACNSQCNGYNACTTTQYCGNGVVEGIEACDGGFQGCVNSTGASGVWYCNSTCSGFGACTPIPGGIQYPIVTQTCGNGIREGTEVCDGTALGNGTCPADTTGSVSCLSTCTGYNTSACTHIVSGGGGGGAPPAPPVERARVVDTTQIVPEAAATSNGMSTIGWIILLFIVATLLYFASVEKAKRWIYLQKEGIVVGTAIAIGILAINIKYHIPRISDGIAMLAQYMPTVIVWIAVTFVFAAVGALVDSIYKPRE